MSTHRRAAVTALCFGVVLLTGCASTNPTLVTGTSVGGIQPAVSSVLSDAVLPSSVYELQVGSPAQTRRLAMLTEIVNRLREQSTSGWQAHQSDDHGFANELSGGRLTAPGKDVAVVAAFMSEFGDVFGPADGFVYESSGRDEAGYSTVRVTQRVGDVPVDGSLLSASVRQHGGESQMFAIRGGVVDVTGVSDTPSITAEEAGARVSRAFSVQAPPATVLMVTQSNGTARLTWGVGVDKGPTGASSSGLGGAIRFPALVLVDAQDGSIIGTRRAYNPQKISGALAAVSAAAPAAPLDFGNYDVEIPTGGRPVVIKTQYLDMFPIEVNAQQLPDGSIILVDATGPQADVRTKKGVILGLDGAGAGTAQNPVKASTLVRYPNAEAIPKDGLYSMWGARQTLDYLRENLGLLSYDGLNSPLPLLFNYTAGASCYDNAYFMFAPGLGHAAFGIPCADENGQRLETWATIDTVAHEIGHGLVHSSGFKRESVQQGAIDEAIADYLGAALRNGVSSTTTPIADIDVCRVFGKPSPFCVDWPGGRGLRSLNTGATFDDYAFTLESPWNSSTVNAFKDSGHTNSMVWTNALWESRKAVASLEGRDMHVSQRARLFDRAVLRSTRTLGEGSSFGQASTALVAAAKELGMTAQELGLIQDRLRANGLCAGCAKKAVNAPGVKAVTVSTNMKSTPVAMGQRVAYLLSTPGSFAMAAYGIPGEPRQQLVGPPASATVTIAGHGDYLLQTQANFRNDGSEAYVLARANLRDGSTRILTDDVMVAVSPAVSAEAFAWVDGAGTVRFQAIAGGPRLSYQPTSPIIRLATSGSRVAMLASDGSLSVWESSSGSVRPLGKFDPSPFDSFSPPSTFMPLGALAMHGDRIAVVGATLNEGPLVVFDLAANNKVTLSTKAVPLGVAISDDRVVWTESLGPHRSPIYGSGPFARPLPDTELLGYAFTQKRFYRMVNFRGQQGFPTLSEDVLAWQESANGHSDIYALRLSSARE